MEKTKAKIEFLKNKVELFKVWSFILLSLGTGLFTLVFWIYGKGEELLKAILTITIVAVFLISVKLLKLNNEIKELSKEIKKELKDDR